VWFTIVNHSIHCEHGRRSAKESRGTGPFLSPPLPLLSPPLTSIPFPYPSLPPLPLEVSPLNPARGSGGAPAEIEFDAKI